MKTFAITFLLLVAMTVSGNASIYKYAFSSKSLAKALAEFAKDHPETQVNFIFDELDTYRTNAKVDTDDAEEALRAIIGLNPVTLIRNKNAFFIEALQHGKHTYTGKAMGSDSRPVEAATVMLLSPKDSTVITYGFTSETGNFAIPCDKENVIVKLTSLGYTPMTFNAVKFELGTIIMHESTVKLKNVNVNVDAASLYSDKNVYIPTSRQKNASKDATDLLLRMAIPQVSVSPSNGVTTPSGEKIRIFINSVEATSEDMFGLKTSEVKKVEYLDFPSDARFLGAEHAVNIIVHEYEYGGYTKFGENAYMNADISSSSTAFSKFVYKKMTYDVYGNFGYFDYNKGGSDSNGRYTFPSGDVERIRTQEKFLNRSMTVPVTFRASYGGKNAYISHTLGYTFSKTLDNKNDGVLRYRPYGDMDYKSSSSSYDTNHSFSLKGNYYFTLPSSWNLAMTYTLNYGHTDSHTNYETDIPDEHPIINNAGEKVYFARLDANATKRFGDNHILQIKGNGGTTIDKVRYKGSSPFNADFSNSFFALPVGYSYVRNKFKIDADAGICMEFIRSNGEKYNDLYPFIHLSGNYTHSTKNQTTMWVQYATNTPGLQQRSPNVLQSNELIYRTGNPNIKNSRHITLNLSHAFYPNNVFGIYPYMRFYTDLDRSIATYEFYQELYEKTGSEALLRTYINNGNYSSLDVGGSFSLRLFNRNLILQVTPQVSHIVSTGYYHRNRTPFEFDFYGQYYFGNFNIAATYMNKGHRNLLWNYGSYAETPSFYKVSCGWGKNDFAVEIQWWNFASYGYEGQTTDYVSPLYSSTSKGISATYSSKVQIYLTYTFGYGKKVNRGNEIGSSDKTSSAIM